MLWFGGYSKFSILFYQRIELQTERFLSKSNITSLSIDIRTGRATARGGGGCALPTEGLQRGEWEQI